MRRVTMFGIAAAAAAVMTVAGCTSGGTDGSTAAQSGSGTVTADSQESSLRGSTTEAESASVNSSPPGDSDTSAEEAGSVNTTEDADTTENNQAGQSGEGSGEPSVSPDVANAIKSAKSYLEFQAFSKKGLINQLSSKAGDNYDKAVAKKAVGQLDVNWKEQAVKSAKNYLGFQAFSKKGLINQLESDAGDMFTHEQAVYGANKAYGSSGQSGEGSGESGVSPDVANAIKSAKSYLEFQAFSKKGLINQLSSKAGDNYDKAVAKKAVGQLDVNWKEQAVKSAKNYLEFQSFSKKGLINQLESDAGDMFTHEQAVYGANKAYGSN